MARAVDLISIVLLLAAPGAFSMGMVALGRRDDVEALYWLVVGGLLLKAASEIMRPRSGS